MSKIEHILAATDLSAPASWAEARAALLAQAHGASVELMYAIGSNVLQALRSALVSESVDAEKVMASVRAELDKAADGLKSEHGARACPAGPGRAE